MSFIRTSAVAAIALALSTPSVVMAKSSDQEGASSDPIVLFDSETAKENLERFNKLDFVGWNEPNWDVYKSLHAESVDVEGFGTDTSGREPHVEWSETFIKNNPDLKIEAHPIQIGAGDWTAVTGKMSNGQTMATFARWENGQIVEEMLFTLNTGE